MKALKITVVGSYKAENGDVIDYEFKDKIIPFISEEKVRQHVSGRYAAMWVMNDKKTYPDRLSHIRETYIEEEEEIVAPKERFSYIGKNIFEMTAEEIQDLAVAKDLLEIPVYRAGSLREAREKAYRAYARHVLGIYLDDDVDFISSSHIKADCDIRVSDSTTISNENILDQEQGGPEMTVDDLMKVAKGMGIAIKGKPSKEDLMLMIRGGKK